MKILNFFMSFVIIVSVTKTAKAVITCPLKKSTVTNFSGCSISDRPGRRQTSSKYSFFESLTSNIDLNVSAIFAHVKPISGLLWNQDPSVLPFLQDGSDDIVFKHFHSLDGFYHGPHNSFKNVWFPPDAIEYQNLNYGQHGDPSDQGNSFLSSNQGGHAGIEYDVIDIVPTPGAIILGGVGLGMIGWLRRYRSL